MLTIQTGAGRLDASWSGDRLVIQIDGNTVAILITPEGDTTPLPAAAWAIGRLMEETAPSFVVERPQG